MIHLPQDPATPLHLKLGKKELESIYDRIVNPFYNRIQADNATKTFIDAQKLPGLKIKQTLFIYRFFTTDVRDLQQWIIKLNHAHKELGIGAEILAPYFFLWSEMIRTWLATFLRLDDAALLLWQEKIYILFGTIMHHYAGTPPPAAEKPETPQQQKDAPRPMLAEKVREIHEAQIQKHIAAQEFLEGIEYDHDLIDELEELEQDAVSSLYDNETVDHAHLQEIASIFDKYAHLLENTYEFKELAFALKSLIGLLEKCDESTFRSKKVSKVLLFLNGILSDIGTWRKEVFVHRRAINVHYLDASLFSSIAQLEILLSQGNIEPEADDPNYLELF